MSDPGPAFLFPAFASDYNDHPASHLPGFDERFSRYLQQAAGAFDERLKAFDFQSSDLLDDELLTQYITYLYSCAASGSLREAGITPPYTAGYSMGIYAALFDAGAVSLTDGLALIREAFLHVTRALGESRFGMATIIGLERSDLERLMSEAGESLEITNQNSPHAFVVSGIAGDVKKLTDLAPEEGALHARLLGVSVPYHAPFLEQAAFGFADSVAGISIKAPSTPIVSLINSAVLSDADSLRTELCANLYHPLNWYQTMRFLLDAGISGFVECGPSRGLVRNSKFITGDFRFFSLSNIIPSHPASGVS